MVIEKILKQLTPERIKKEIEAIQEIRLPADLQKWVIAYNKVGDRDDFFWRWLYISNQKIVFPVVSKQYQKSLAKTKVLFNMFLALLDDVADKEKNKRLLNELLKTPFEQDYIKFDQLDPKEKKYLKFTKKVWRYIEKITKKYPCYEEFKEILEYDITQLLNAMKYAYLINRNPYLINKTEHWIYLSHNMQAIIDLTFDLMCFPKFNIENLGVFREIAWEAQKMARIGNSISTWEREIKENDFTSGVFAYAIEEDIITLQELQKIDKSKVIEEIKKSNIENQFLVKWQNSYNEIRKIGREIQSVNIGNFLRGMEKLLFFHLISRGYK